ncbi:MAG: hypothetical protein EOM05_04770 [Clostridia bacterium]|nr:hypothetical protein [Clostridia bacterium]
MNKIIASLIVSFLMICMFASSASALTVEKDVYSGAFDVRKYPVKDSGLSEVPPSFFKEKETDNAYDMILYGAAWKGGPHEKIDRTYIDYPSYEERFSEYWEEILEYPFVNADGEENKYVGKATINASNEITKELETWEHLSKRKINAGEFKSTTLHGRPALVREKGNKEYGKDTELGDNACYSFEAFVLIDDTNLFGCLMLNYKVSLSYKIIGFGIGFGWEDNWDGFDAKQKDWWSSTLVPKSEDYIEKASDVTVKIKRERLYDGKLGVAKKDEKKDNESVNIVEDTFASENKGEDSISIPEAAAIAIIGIGVAVAGAGAGSNNGGDNENSRKKSQYKMCLRKDFGDAIRIGASPVPIYARIIEISPEGEEIDRPDLSQTLTITSKDYLEVDSCQMSGNYMGAMVYAPDKAGEQKPENSSVSIKFAGNEGSFTNNVSFRIIGKPFLAFPERGDYLEMTLNLLLGDGNTYETPFMPQDFIDPPEKIEIKTADNAPFEAEYEKTDESNYVLRIKNLSEKPEKAVFKKISSSLTITAENEKEKTESVVRIEIYPEGLSISHVPLNNDILQFSAFDSKQTSQEGEIEPTQFNMHLAVQNKSSDGKVSVSIVDAEKFDPVFETIKGSDQKTENLCKKFSYEIVKLESSLKKYAFTPKEALVEDEENPFHVTLPVSCTYGESDYKLELPVRLIGGGPGPMEERAKELEKMKNIISKVGGISNNVAMQLRKNRDKLSAAELRIINKQICQDAIDYYTKDAQDLIQTANTLESLEYWADWIKWLGDQAFSYLMTVYTGSGEIILTPAKEMCVEFIAELIADAVDGEELSSMDFSMRLEKLNVLKKIDGMIENVLMSVATGENVSVKKAASCLAGWFVYKVAKNIQDNIEKTGNYNVFDAILSAGKDLTGEAMKKAGMKQFEKLLKNPSVKDKFEKWFGDFVGKHIKNNYELFYNSDGLMEIKDIATRSEAAKKLIEGLMGEGINWTFNQFKSKPDPKAGKQVESSERITLTADGKIKVVLITPNEKTGEGFVAELDIISSFKGIFSFFFGDVFGSVPFETTTKNSPKDPVLYKS